ncbi:DUF6276 family protein [Halobacterium salinarum]|nr:DUF6276 family protein [Halobacterium salinarum]MDL0126248.1 DUF6276 family protein [Halobacterium salinarum]
MTCSNCGCPVVSFPIPASVSDCLPDDRPGAVLCTQCLRVAPTDDPPDDYPDFARASDAFPADGETAAVLACLLAPVDRLASTARTPTPLPGSPNATASTCCCSWTASQPTQPSPRRWT